MTLKLQAPTSESLILRLRPFMIDSIHLIEDIYKSTLLLTMKLAISIIVSISHFIFELNDQFKNKMLIYKCIFS